MKKEEFLRSVQQQLSLLPQEELQSRLEYLSESIDDRIEDGMTEEEAVAALGEPKEVADNVLLDTPLQTLMQSRRRPALKGWHIALIVIGAAVWLPLLLAAAAVVLAVVLTVVAVLLSLCAAVPALSIGGLASTVMSVAGAFSGDLSSLAITGVSLAAIGLGVILLFAVKSLLKLCVKGIRAFVVHIKKSLLKRRKTV